MVYLKLNELNNERLSSQKNESHLEHLYFEIDKIFSLLFEPETKLVELYSKAVYDQIEAETH